MATVCKRVLYSGQVQGVGFRYTAQGLATGYPIAGYVRNLPSGEVELVAEGDSASVESYLTAVGQRMAGYITNVVMEDAACTGQQGFRIRH